MLNLFRRLTQCKERAEKAIAQSEECSTAYRDALEKNEKAYLELMEKIDRRGPHRKMSAA